MNDKAGTRGSPQPGADIGAEDVAVVKGKDAQDAPTPAAGAGRAAAALAERASLVSAIESDARLVGRAGDRQGRSAEVIERRPRGLRAVRALSVHDRDERGDRGARPAAGVRLRVVIGGDAAVAADGADHGAGLCAGGSATGTGSKQSAYTLLMGSLLAVLLCAALVYLSPIQTITSEIAARTRPNLFDLFVALFSALAGALCDDPRTRRHDRRGGGDRDRL